MRIIAFYLPQFHRIPENDKWWGEGFTEWTSTRKAQPLFKNHYQPREPYADNYYDLTDPVARKWQAHIARRYGIYGFCYYHYWFNGYLLLQRPIEEVLKTKEPDFPFCMCWANEPWTRAWDGLTSQVLMPQEYGAKADWKRHFEYLVPFFSDKRYIRIDGKPLFVVYRSASIEKCSEMLKYWNELAKSYGFKGIYFAEMLTIFRIDKRDVKEFDARIEFEPMYTIRHRMPLFWRGLCYLRSTVRNLLLRGNVRSRLFLFRVNYDLIWHNILRRKRDSTRSTFLGAFVDWDNSPRKNYRATILQGATPRKFGYYLRRQIKRAEELHTDFIFINAWNEWAEGAYLEPDKKFKFAYLAQIRKSLT